ncbi:Uncharacterised protein [uncultured archaeon]|nr:Uncharacterised protein [uncultured archaeon]
MTIGVFIMYFWGLATMLDVQRTINTEGKQMENLLNQPLGNPVSKEFDIPFENYNITATRIGNVTHFFSNETTNPFGSVQVKVDLSSDFAYVGDRINFIPWARTLDPNDISEIDVILIDSREQVKNSYNEADAVEQETSHFHTSLRLFPQIDPEFANFHHHPTDFVSYIGDKGSLITFSDVGDKVVQILVFHNYNFNNVDSVVEKVPVTTIHSEAELIQYRASVLTLQQGQKQISTDVVILGLTGIGIGLAFIVISFDILLRIFLDPYTAEMKNNTCGEGIS